MFKKTTWYKFEPLARLSYLNWQEFCANFCTRISTNPLSYDILTKSTIGGILEVREKYLNSPNMAILCNIRASVILPLYGDSCSQIKPINHLNENKIIKRGWEGLSVSEWRVKRGRTHNIKKHYSSFSRFHCKYYLVH